MDAIVVVRHAHPKDPADGSASHWTDTELSDLGRRQAACVAARLKREIGGAPCRVYCSDLRRASQTADIICGEIGLAARPLADLREYNNGMAAGGTLEELKRSSAAAGATRPTLDLHANPQGETWAEFYRRVSACMDRLVGEQDRLLLVVAHYGTIINIVTWWLELGLTESGDAKVSFDASLASISVLKATRRGKRAVERLNDTAHLYAEGLAPGLQLFA